MNKRIVKFIAALLISQSCLAFTLGSSSNSSLEGWSGSEVSFVINTTNCPSNVDLNSIVDDAVKVWNNVPNSRLKVSRGGASTGQTYSNPPTIWCSTNLASDAGGADPSFVAGAGVFGTSGNTIVQGQIILNAQVGAGAYIGNMNSSSLKIILAHEMGHVLGLGHSASSAALMYYDASAKTDLTLAQDDMDGIAYLYPRNELGSDKIMGCGMIKNSEPPRPSMILKNCLALLLPLLAWALLRFRESQQLQARRARRWGTSLRKAHQRRLGSWGLPQLS